MNPIELAREIEERYQRYLKTTFYFKDRELRDSFEEALSSGHLSKGPFLEATPVFKRGQTPRFLFPDLLGSQPDEGFLEAVQGRRPLYKHQEDAIQRVFMGHNVVVATGTGSGKTEAFLYPILLHLYQEFQAGTLGPGVRALILYPMNALANDQRERLEELCKRLKENESPFRFTFGQYIGETPENENDSQRHAGDQMSDRAQKNYSFVENGVVVHGELVLRSEMRRTPPHILLTNYSMLEYLLLRPDDSLLFDNGRAKWWTFLVLDEAHQYRGSRGIEMAMLLRRLKQRLRAGGRSKPFRCIATSATLAGGEADNVVVANFASDLFGEKFHPEDVILGQTEPTPDIGSESLSEGDYCFLRDALNGNAGAGNRLAELATRLGLPLPVNEDLPKAVGALLQHDHRVTELRRYITGNPAEIQDIADQVFEDLPEQKRVSALSELVDLLLQTKNPVTDSPLLSARYHLFLRSLEGAFVSYWPQKKVFLDRKAGENEYTAFEVALCRECGQHYFVAQKDLRGGKLMEAIRDPSHVNFGATFFRPIENDNDTGDEEEENDEANFKRIFQLCIQCGEVHPSKPMCGHDHLIQVVREDPSPDEDKADQMARCGACGYNAAGRDPVREVVHGTDGPHAVIATTLYQALPENRKKVLAFADGRQEAAFFAWYLEDSYKDILSRNMMLKIALSFIHYPAMGISLSTIADQAFSRYHEAFKYRPSDDEPTIRKNIWRAIYREFLTEEHRISLEGVGLIQWSIEWPDWFKFPVELTHNPWSLSEQETLNLIFTLLDTMRTDRAVELQPGMGISLSWNDLDLQAFQMRFRIGPPARPRNMRFWPVRSWDGNRGGRTLFLAKLLTRAGIPEQEALVEAVNILRSIWDSIRRSDEETISRDRLLIPVDDARRLNPDWWRLNLIASQDTIYQCDTCARLQSVSIRGVCPRHGCRGTLKEVFRNNLEPNHYRILYEEDLPGFLRVEEHTAQLDKEKAREFQREFKQGKIHVLSCSTTFELGVDLGDLDTIFLRNVPPEAFNYAQRVGRAGRRERPGFAITYCRRSPHDLYHFAEPERMLGGKVRPPVLSLQNVKIVTRHIAATALSYFFQTYKERFINVKRLFKDLEHPSGVTEIKAFLHEHKDEMEVSLRAIVPSNMFSEVGLDNGQWIERITGKITESESSLSLAEAEISSDYVGVMRLEEEARAKRDYRTAEWAQRRANTIAGEDVLSFLSRKAIIPKYGFPVDVVELDTQKTQQNQEAFEVLLQRDLNIAISEFAPTSKLVANKKVWTSYGLKKVAEKEWPRKFYKRCARHNIFLHWERGQPEPPTLCGDHLPVSQYVIPRFGFVTDRDRPKEPTSRTPRIFTTRPYFAGSISPDPGIISLPLSSGLITLTKATPGLMAVLCEGRRGEGFYVCGGCGAGFRKRERAHKTPYGQDCPGTLEQVSLGHEFVTDVLQLQFRPQFNGDIESVWFAYSLAYALVEGASEEVLEVPSNDLSATVAHGEQCPVPPIILYDNVPGGAGLVARLEQENNLKTCLDAALRRVSGNCGCNESTSCYGCLRSYRNQFAHQYLQRGPVLHYLSDILTHW